MTTRWSVGLSLAAGLVGGTITHWVFPAAASAQGRPPAVIQAQSFALVDSNGKVIATLSGNAVSGPTTPAVTITTPDGQVIFRAPEVVMAHPLVNR